MGVDRLDFDELSLEGSEEVSFIKLSHIGQRLPIEAVQKSNLLGKSDRFCSTALPAAISSFFDIHSLTLSDVTSIGVLNAAD
jgi:hypothetical protein